MLRAYLDDSGKSHDPQHLALSVGGYMLAAEEWNHFDRQWQAALKDHNAPYFHCKEAMHLRGEFSTKKGWTRDKVDVLYRDLLSILPGLRPTGVVAAVDLQQYLTCFPATGKKVKEDDPYFLCLHTCLAIIETLPPWEDEIAVVIDQNDEFRHQALRMFDDVGQALERITLGGVSFCDMRLQCGLQAADILAWETNKRTTEYLRGTSRSRKSLEYLLEEIATHPKLYDKDELMRIKDMTMHQGLAQFTPETDRQ